MRIVPWPTIAVAEPVFWHTNARGETGAASDCRNVAFTTPDRGVAAAVYEGLANQQRPGGAIAPSYNVGTLRLQRLPGLAVENRRGYGHRIPDRTCADDEVSIRRNG
jgi:hypothetical protein